MSLYPSRRRADYLPLGGPPSDPVGDRAFVRAWLGHVAAGRIGGHLSAPDAAPSEAEVAAAERIRAIHAANERLICGDRTRPNG
jgi:hypothetical protein